jgi:hypothetical protein
MDKKFHSLLVNGPKKRGRNWERDNGRANQKLEKCLHRSYVYKVRGYCPWTALL